MGLRMPAAGIVGAVLLAATSGCGDERSTSASGAPSKTPATAPATGENEPVTPQALAWVAAEHAGTPDSATREYDAAEEFRSGGVGAELRYGSGGEYDGDALVVAVGKRLDPAVTDCDSPDRDHLAGCVRTEQGTLMWEAETPEEDPGVVYVVAKKRSRAVLMFYAGPNITGDPRELDMPLSVDLLFAIANDPRVDVTTSAVAVDAGAGLSYWED